MSSENKYQVMPDPKPEEYAALKADIAERGIQTPIIEDEHGNTLDGHTRLRAYKELLEEGCDLDPYPRTVRTDLEDDVWKRTQARRENTLRRQLNSKQKGDLVDQQLKDTPEYSNGVIAKWLGVGHGMVRAHRIELEWSGKITCFDQLIMETGQLSASRSKIKDNPTGVAVASTEQRRQWATGGSMGDKQSPPSTAEGNGTLDKGGALEDHHNQTLGEQIQSGKVPDDLELPSGKLSPEQEAFYAISKYFNTIAKLDPQAVANAAADIKESRRALDDCREVVDWFGMYEEALEKMVRPQAVSSQ